MTFQEAIQSGFQNYANFTGRSQRSAYWWWQLFCILIGIGLSIIDAVAFSGFITNGNGPLVGLWSLAILIPNLAIGVRRLHDRDMSGWFMLLILIPVLGALILLYFFVTAGTQGPNRFGPDPLDDPRGPFSAPPEDDGARYSESNIPRVDPDA